MHIMSSDAELAVPAALTVCAYSPPDILYEDSFSGGVSG